MPEFNLTPEARSSPTSCFLCGEFEGPFVTTGIDKIEGTIILCAPKYDGDTVKSSGCVGGIAHAAGYVSPLEHGAEVNASAKMEAELRDAIAELEAELDKPTDGVDLAPLFERIDGLEATVIDALGKIAAPKPKPAAPQKRTP